MEASFSGFLPRRVKNYRHIFSSALLAFSIHCAIGSNDEEFPEFPGNSVLE
jgi:hypothetical protein